MLAGILRFEWRYQTRRWTFAAVAATFGCLGFGLAASAFGPDDVPINSPYSIALAIGIASLLALLAATLFAAQAALRDSEHRMHEILEATAFPRERDLFARFAGAFAALATACAGVLPGLLLGTFAVSHPGARVAAFDPAPYLRAFAVLALPNLLFALALLFAVALATRRSLATYVSGVMAYFLYFAAALVSGSPLMAGSTAPSEHALAWAARLDPFGLSAFYAASRFWTEAERSARAFDLAGPLGTNRCIWLALTALGLTLAVRFRDLRLPRRAGRGRIDDAPTGASHTALRRTTPERGVHAALAGFGGLVRMELRHALGGWPLPVLLVAWLAFVAIELAQTFGQREFGTVWLPATPLVLRELSQPLAMFGSLLVLVFAGELVWRERTAGMAEIVDATPLSTGVLAAAKLAALGALVLVFTLAGAAAALGFQWLSGWTPLEPARCLAVLSFVAVPLLLIAALALAIQVVVPNRHFGVLAGALAVLFWHHGVLGGPGHPLLRFAGLPEIPFSELAGFAPERRAFAALALYWTACATLLVAFAVALWPRGTAAGLGLRWRRATTARGAWRALAAVSAVLWIGLGAVLLAGLQRAGGYRTAQEIEAWRAAYERGYRAVEARPQPVPVELVVDVELFPRERRAQLSGRYKLENRTGQPIDALWIAVPRTLARVALTLDGRAPVQIDAAFGMHRFAPPVPLPPSGAAELTFQLEIDRHGLSAEPERDLLESGSFLLGHLVLPSVGYRRSYELADPRARERQELPVLARASAFGEDEGAEDGATVPIRFAATITTASDQIAVAPGRLVSSEERAGRRTFRYRSEAAISPVVAFASGRWRVARRQSGGVAIEVLHHPGHGRNVPAMLDAAARALDYGRRVLGPYPHSDLRIVELPSLSLLARRGTGFALPGMVFLLEHSGFFTDRSDPARVDVVSKRVAHEVAHQWFGHQLSPAPGPGATALVESLARDAELRVLAELHGERAVAPVLAWELERYLAGRSAGQEPPLAAVERESWIYYSKGALVMAAVRDRIGHAATERALHGLFDEVRSGRQPTARDLIARLQAEAPAEARELIADWWNRVVLYDLSVQAASATPAAAGRQHVELELRARRSVLAQGAEQRLPFDEDVEIALFAQDPGSSGGGAPPLHLERVRLRGDRRLTLEVDAAARWVLLDPHLRRIERIRADNLRPIEGGAPANE